jgi:conjugal transfer pilus assembly protein TraB
MFFRMKSRDQAPDKTDEFSPAAQPSGGIKAFWAPLSPDQKRRILMVGVVAAIVLLALVGYKAKYGSKEDKRPKVSDEHAIDIDSGMIEKSLYTRTIDIVEQQQKELQKLSKQIEELRDKSSYTAPADHLLSPLVQVIEPLETTPPEPGKEQSTSQEAGEQPVESKPPRAYRIPPALPVSIPEKETVQMVGGINIIKNEEKPGDLKKTLDKKKQKIYLPPSFMEATLLSGVAAPTTLAAKSNPLPVLLRIKDLAVLPNKVKADLKGCFAIAEATGNLADERVHIRVLTISCVAKNGDAVIDQQVKGFVVDEDGKVGLAGKVVAKMGIHIARSALAGFLAGFGEAVEQTSANTTYNPAYGTTQIWTETDTKNVTKAGVGKGISQAAKELQKFYLQLAEQTLPVIEVGATKSVTLVISEGVDLEIKKQDTHQDGI